MSHDLHVNKPATSGKVVSAGPGPATERFTLDYASWYARLATPGSKSPNGMAQPAASRILRLETAARPATSAAPVRRIA